MPTSGWRQVLHIPGSVVSARWQGRWGGGGGQGSSCGRRCFSAESLCGPRKQLCPIGRVQLGCEDELFLPLFCDCDPNLQQPATFPSLIHSFLICLHPAQGQRNEPARCCMPQNHRNHLRSYMEIHYVVLSYLCVLGFLYSPHISESQDYLIYFGIMRT